MRLSWVGGEEMMDGVKRFIIDLSHENNVKRILAVTQSFSGFSPMAAMNISDEQVELEVPSEEYTGAFESGFEAIWPTFSEINVLMEQPVTQIRINRKSIEFFSSETTQFGLVIKSVSDVRNLWEDQVKEKTKLVLKAETSSTEDQWKVSDRLLVIGRIIGLRIARVSTVDPNIILRSGFKPKATYVEDLQELTSKQLRSRESDNERMNELVIEGDEARCILFLGEDLKSCVITMESENPDLLSNMIRIWETGG